MKIVVMLFFLIIAAVLQAAMPTWTWLGQANAPLLLSCVLYYALTHERSIMIGAAVLGGLIQDSLSLAPLGMSSFCFCVAGAIAARFKDTVFVHQGITYMLFGSLANIGVTVTIFILLRMQDLVRLSLFPMVLKILGALILGAFITPLVFWAIEATDRLVGNVEVKES